MRDPHRSSTSRDWCVTPSDGRPRGGRAALDRDAATAMKYVVVSGGVVSGLGKGVTASSVGVLLRASGLRVTSVKIDPYINIDAGTMSPFEHGETYVLDDGGESDLDLGNYERFVDVSLTRDHNITTGKVYQVRARGVGEVAISKKTDANARETRRTRLMLHG